MSERPGEAEQCEFLLAGGSVVTLDDDRRIIDRGAVAIEGDRIVAVGSADELAHYRPARVVDCSGRVVLPGLIDCHTHLFQGLIRTAGEGIPLWTWLRDLMWPYSAAISVEDVRIAALLGAIECARAGTTSLLDHHYAPPSVDGTMAVAGAIEDVGLRGVVARGMAGVASPVAERHGLASEVFRFSLEEELAMTRECMAARPAGGMVAVWPGPHNVAYSDPDLIRAAADLAGSAGVGWHSHCSVRKEDPDVFEGVHGTRPFSWLHHEGLLSDRTTLAHSIHLDDEEVGYAGQTETNVVYCPVSHQIGACGVIRLRDLRTAGARVGLGSDGAGYCHRQDLFEAMKNGMLLQRVHTLDPTASTSEEALDLATREGARILDLDAGVLAPGKLADVIVVDVSRPHLRPLHQVVAALVNSVRGSDVEMTMVNGRVVYEAGRCLLVDEVAVMEEAQARAESLLSRAGLDRFRDLARNSATPTADRVVEGA